MKNEFVKYKQALSLKELGFNEPCFGYYIETGEWAPASYSQKGTLYPSNSDLIGKWVSAPLYQQAFRWLRNQYATCWYIQSEYPAFYGLYIHNGIDYDHYVYDTYEEAEQACLNKLIEIVKKQ